MPSGLQKYSYVRVPSIKGGKRFPLAPTQLSIISKCAIAIPPFLLIESIIVNVVMTLLLTYCSSCHIICPTNSFVNLIGIIDSLEEHMNIDYLRTFLTLAENGSFSETAKEHIVVQSTVSSRIQELEKSWGRVFLFVATTAELTLAGQAFLEYAKNIVELENRAIDRIGLVGQFSERLTIGTVYAFHKCYLVQGTRRFWKSIVTFLFA